MARLRKMLIDELEKIPGIDIHLWQPDRDFLVIYYKGKEVAHFHGNNELDVRLSPQIVKTKDSLTRRTESGTLIVKMAVHGWWCDLPAKNTLPKCCDLLT